MPHNSAKGKNLKFLRENNTNAVLKVLATKGETSRIDLSKILGLSKMTITNIITELLELDYVMETKIQLEGKNMTTGPKPMLLTIKPNRILAIGIYASREGIYCSLSDAQQGEIFVERTPLTKDDTEYTLANKIAGLVYKILQRNPTMNRNIIGIGVASVGLVDSKKGEIINSPDFVGKDNLKIKEMLEKNFPYPVYVRNEVQAAVLAEQLYGNGRNINNFVYFALTYGIGTAVVSGGKVLIGNRGFATEAGHMSIKHDGEVCRCGNRGCMELYASVPVLLKRTGAGTFREFLNMLEKKNKAALEARRELIEVLDIGLTNLTNIFDPEYIIIGHEGALLDDGLTKELEKRVNEHCIQRREQYIHLKKSAFADKAALRGATAIVFNQLFSGNIHVLREA